MSKDKQYIPMEDVAAIAKGGIEALNTAYFAIRSGNLTVTHDGKAYAWPAGLRIDEGLVKDARGLLNGYSRESVLALFQSGALTLNRILLDGDRMSPEQFGKVYGIDVDSLRFDETFFQRDHSKAETAPQTTILSPQQARDLSPEALLERFLLKEGGGRDV